MNIPYSVKTNLKNSPEYQSYLNSEIWKPLTKIIPASQLIDKNDRLLNYLYQKIKQQYKKFPLRKDGTDPFIHPLNTFCYLKKAGIDDPVTLAAGFLHDYIEENVDLYKEEEKIGDDEESFKILNKHELELLRELNNDLKFFCKKEKINPTLAKKITDVIYILTREKSHLYYRSISEIFNSNNEKTKERAIQIKLADRTHNIQTLSSYNEEGRIYQCFKNLFILNNAKRYLLEIKGSKKKRAISPTGKLFAKCCKSTYEAFLEVCHMSSIHKFGRVKSLLHLSFRKYVSQHGGLWAVTKVMKDETHLIRLFQGVIRKYDARLHMEHDRFKKMEDYEVDFCKKYFAEYNFNDKKIRSLIHYKDAYALKEVVVRLLYKKDYVIFRFGCSDLCTRGKICMESDK
tara:strand:- start:11 stop:1213 length:1203 start_codon:yes stop_codon:yes gene_type:complete